MARIALITALIFATVVGFILLAGLSGDDGDLSLPGTPNTNGIVPKESMIGLSEEELYAIVAKRFPEAGILEAGLADGGGLLARLLFGEASYDVALDGDGNIISIASAAEESLIIKEDVGKETEAPVAPKEQTAGTAATEQKILTAALVATHGSSRDCWMIIGGKVYDVTSYLKEHPGGASVMTPYCGKDGTKAFATKDKAIPKPHSGFAEGLLDAYYVGFVGEVLESVSVSAGENEENTATPEGSAKTPETKTASAASVSEEIALPVFAVGDAVKTTAVLNVREKAGTGNVSLGKQELAARGTIIAGPVFAAGYWWWEIDYASAPDGWSAEDFLVLMKTTAETTPIPPKTAPAPEPATTFPPAATPPPPPAVPPASSITVADVAAHGAASDCWVIFENKVYDVTSYLSSHPGGAGTIMPYCGDDLTASFMAQGHSQYARTLFVDYYVGDLTVAVTPPPAEIPPPPATPAPTCTLSANPTTITRGDNTTLSWSSTDTTAASINQSIGTVAGSGSQTLSPVNTVTYTLSVTGDGGYGDCSVTVTVNDPPAGPQTYTPADVAAHATAGNCWVIFENKVYDVTSYLSAHPGGAGAITPYCGADLTAPFDAQGHSNSARNIFANYYVGDLDMTGGGGGNAT